MSSSSAEEKVVKRQEGEAGAARPMHGLVPAIVALAIFAPILRHGFVWGDRDLLLRGSWFADRGRLLDAVNSPLVFSDNYFRPLGILVLGVEARLFALAPWGFHLVSLLLHGLAAWLVARIALRMREGAPKAERWWHDGALVGALMYALHPALAEGSCFVSAQFDALLTVFLLAALLADRVVDRPIRRAIAVGGCFFLALLCKETAAGFVLVLPCVHLARPTAGKPWRDRLAAHRPTYAALFASSLAYLVWRVVALGGLLDLSAGTMRPSLVASSDALARSLQLMLWPMGSLTPIQLPAASAGELALDAAFLLIVIAGVCELVRRGFSAGWWLAAVLVSLLPISQPWLAVMADGAVTAERFLVFPMALLCLAIARAWPSRAERPLLSIVGMWCGGAALTSLLISLHWRDELSLWSWATEVSPASAVAWTHLSHAQMRRGELAAVETSAARAIELDPDVSMAWNNRGMARLSLGRFAEAEADFRAALKHGPTNVKAANNLAIALLSQNHFSPAEQILRGEALRIDPHDPYAHLILGELLLRRGEPSEALEHLAAGLRALPTSDPAAAQDAKRLLGRARQMLSAPRPAPPPSQR